jgi:hypothetical protein
MAALSTSPGELKELKSSPVSLSVSSKMVQSVFDQAL